MRGFLSRLLRIVAILLVALMAVRGGQAFAYPVHCQPPHAGAEHVHARDSSGEHRHSGKAAAACQLLLSGCQNCPPGAVDEMAVVRRFAVREPIVAASVRFTSVDPGVEPRPPIRGL